MAKTPISIYISQGTGTKMKKLILILMLLLPASAYCQWELPQTYQDAITDTLNQAGGVKIPSIISDSLSIRLIRADSDSLLLADPASNTKISITSSGTAFTDRVSIPDTLFQSDGTTTYYRTVANGVVEEGVY